MLGFKGILVNSFADLVKELWTVDSVVEPAGFKATLAKLNEQFAGYDQQDSQEFVSFLIDSLHEEVNQRTTKPFIENPSSEDRNLVELGLETWSNNLRRDWSFIFFLFYGQIKSSLTCLSCGTQSTKFELSTTLALSLPESSKISVTVIVHRLASAVKQLLGDRHIAKDKNPDQPIQVSLQVDRQINVSELASKIGEVINVKVDYSEIALYSKQNEAIRGILDP